MLPVSHAHHHGPSCRPECAVNGPTFFQRVSTTALTGLPRNPYLLGLELAMAAKPALPPWDSCTQRHFSRHLQLRRDTKASAAPCVSIHPNLATLGNLLTNSAATTCRSRLERLQPARVLPGRGRVRHSRNSRCCPPQRDPCTAAGSNRLCRAILGRLFRTQRTRAGSGSE
jgi:hypothetical protein